MPVETHSVHLRPADFFEGNPSIDVPSNKNLSSQEVYKTGSDGNSGQKTTLDCCVSVNASTVPGGDFRA
jgi:primary-amine oxidase